MESQEFEGPDEVEVRVPKDESRRTCPKCGRDCCPGVGAGPDELGVRIAFICPKQSVHTVIDPFEDKR